LNIGKLSCFFRFISLDHSSGSIVEFSYSEVAVGFGSAQIDRQVSGFVWPT
jgi:hypothetical protein